MDYITDAFEPFQTDESAIKKCLIGTLVLVASIFILPYFVYQGYLLRLLEKTRTGIPKELPEWDNVGGLFVDGVVAMAISLVISLPAMVITYVPKLMGAEQGVVLITQLVGSGLSLIFSYMTLAFLVLYARDGLDGVLDLDRAINILLSIEYLVATIATMVGGIIFGLFTFMLAIFTLGFGLILLPFIAPPVNYLFMMIVGGAVSELEGTVESGGSSDNEDGTEDLTFETRFEESESTSADNEDQFSQQESQEEK